MTITEGRIEAIQDYKLRVKKKPEPRSSNLQLPPFYFNALFIGSTGTGKSYKLVELLKLYEKYGIYDADGNKMDMRIILVCPTINSGANVVYQSLKIEEEDKILNYDEDIFEEKVNDIIEEQTILKEHNKFVDAYKKFHKYQDVEIMTDDELDLLEKYNGFDEIENLRRKTEKVYFIIFDDMIGTEAFKNKRKSKINNLVILCRHHNINMFFTTQFIKGIPPIIRSNIRLFVIFKFANSQRVIDSIYPEVSAIVKEEEFQQLYEYATNEPHDAFVVIINNDIDKKFRIRKNWNYYLKYNNNNK